MPPSTLLNPEGVSPELALVDSQLAEIARSSLPQEDTLARIELLVRAHRIFDSRSLVRASPQTNPKETTEPTAPAEPTTPAELVERVEPRRPAPLVEPGRPGRRRPAVVAGGFAAAALTSALLFGVRVDLSGQPAGADSSSISVPPVAVPGVAPDPSKPTAKSKPRRTTQAKHQKGSSRRPNHRAAAPTLKPGKASQGRRFVWAPAPGATSYRVQFFRGSTVVFEATTTRPEITVPSRWTLRGVRRALTPGIYRWNVWPVTAGGQQSKAVVQAELSIPAR